MKFFVALCLLLCGLALPPQPAVAQDLNLCCQRAAAATRQTGEKARCYVAVCVRYLRILSNGSCGAFEGSFDRYRQALHSQCGISR